MSALESLETWYQLDYLLSEEGVRAPAYLQVDAAGKVLSLGDAPPTEGPSVVHLPGYALPGLSNLHSHSFQRALSGRGECRTQIEEGEDSFWSWRQAMYALADRLDPEAVQAIAAWTFVELLEGGYTRVGEFHYLHHDPKGQPYAQPEQMSLAILEAAESAGLGLCLLPVLYQRGGFGQAASDLQRRFLHPDLEDYGRLVEGLTDAAQGDCVIGVAPHSLRAVDAQGLDFAFALARAKHLPVHLHIAEQPAEVSACQAALGATPVQWLLDHQAVDADVCLVHATWTDDAERKAIVRSGAVVGLCPSTEANLGDGFFPVGDFLAQGGCFGIGSDANLQGGAADELRLLEEGARLRTGRRCVVATLDPPAKGAVAQTLWREALRGGAQALSAGDAVPALRPGSRADLVVLDPNHPRLLGHGPETALEAFVLGGGQGAISEVISGGRHVVHEGRHRKREVLLRPFQQTMRRLWEHT